MISERIQREDIFTSVHVDEYIMEVRDTKRGVEELTSDIPNVSEDATKDLDANGIVRIGANIHPGDTSSARSPRRARAIRRPRRSSCARSSATRPAT